MNKAPPRKHGNRRWPELYTMGIGTTHPFPINYYPQLRTAIKVIKHRYGIRFEHQRDDKHVHVTRVA